MIKTVAVLIIVVVSQCGSKGRNNYVANVNVNLTMYMFMGPSAPSGTCPTPTGGHIQVGQKVPLPGCKIGICLPKGLHYAQLENSIIQQNIDD
jgi:hypothetical protein